MNKLKVLDLFSGIGGFSLGLERTGGFETVAFCEIEDYPRKVLAKHWPNVPIHKDVRELQEDAVGHIDLICGGYPCQPFSLAGNRRGKEDDRHLWPEVARLMDAIRPTWGLFENVAGHINMGLDEVLSELEGQGYTAWTLVIPACAVDAPHRRDRVWIIAHNDRQHRSANEREPNAKTDGRHKFGGVCKDVSDTQNEGVIGRYRKQRDDDGGSGRGVFDEGRGRADDGAEDVADTSGNGLQGQWEDRGATGSAGLCGRARSDKVEDIREACNSWEPEPRVGRVAHGVPNRSHRLKGLGNAVVPKIPEMIGRAILKSYES